LSILHYLTDRQIWAGICDIDFVKMVVIVVVVVVVVVHARNENISKNGKKLKLNKVSLLSVG
jgi:hypothetical protein